MRCLRSVIAALAALSLTVAGAVVLAPAASAAAPEPDTPRFGRAIDPLAAYDPQTTCSPTAKPGTTAFADLIKKTYGSSQTVYISRSCTSGGTSEHKEGRAFDWMRSVRVASQKEQADALVRWLLRTDQYGNNYAMARRLGVMYIIWKSRMWRAYDPGRGWPEYSNCLSDTRTSQDTRCHRDHVHISLSWPGALAQTSWYTQATQPQECSATGTAQAPSLPTPRAGFVPVRQARVVNTASGTGLGGTQCRLVASHPSVFKVTGLGGVPATGVSAVALGVRMQNPSQSSWLTVYPAGATKPAGPTVSSEAGVSRSATTVVPVGGDGKVATSLSGGSAGLSLDVLGYYPSTGSFPYRAARQQRILTRTLAPQQTATVRVGGNAGIPTTGVRGVVLGGHVWSPDAAGGLAAWTALSSATPPGVSAVRFSGGTTRTGRLVVPSTSDGRIKLQNRSASPISFSIDTVGWFGSGLPYRAVRSSLVMDTRSGLGVARSLSAGTSAALDLSGRVPTSARAVALQVSAVGPSADTRVSAWRAGIPQPSTGQFYPRAGETSVEVVVVAVGPDGRVWFGNRSGTVDLRASLLGYYTP